jgi:hypothetical protein
MKRILRIFSSEKTSNSLWNMKVFHSCIFWNRDEIWIIFSNWSGFSGIWAQNSLDWWTWSWKCSRYWRRLTWPMVRSTWPEVFLNFCVSEKCYSKKMMRILFLFESKIILKSNLLHALENTENLNTLNKMKNAVF